MSQKAQTAWGGFTPDRTLPIADKCAESEVPWDDLFSPLSEPSREALQKLKHAVSYPAGAIIFTEGQPARGVYILCRGQVKLLTANSGGRTLIIKIAQPGEELGLNSVISDRPYELTAEILQPAELAFIPRADFLRLITEHSDACLVFASHLSRDYHAAEDVLRSIGLCQSASVRLARFLLERSSNRPGVDGAVQVKLALTHEEIGQLIGTSRETVTRTLSELRRRRTIDLNGSTLVLRNKPVLESIAGD